jgi:regulatory protein
MKIVKYKKIGSNKYKIYFDDDNIVLYEDVILKHNLLLKKEIDNDLLIEINKDNYKASIYDISLKYIGIRMRSKKELKEYLIKKKFDNKDIDECINKLEYHGHLNDEYFCKCYINDKINLTNNGIDKIKDDLVKLGIEENVIEKKLSNIDKNILNDKLVKIINKELRINAKLPIGKLKSKVINRCINLGYKLNNINDILDNINIESNSNIEADYNKLYKKYSSKYDEYKLKSVLKSKLYQKGYEMDDINKIVN